MKRINHTIKLIGLVAMLLAFTACHDLLDEPAENRTFTEETDYTESSNMISPLIGTYAAFYSRGWENFPLISVRGDDVNHGGLGDQQDFAETDMFRYNKDYWMYNSLWEGLYSDIYAAQSAMIEFELYKENGANAATADQYIAEAKTMQAFLLFQLARVWGDVFIPATPDPADLLVADLSTKQEVMQFISDQMDEAIGNLPAVHPNERTDVRGGVTRYTALAMKALANLEMENYQAVADATSQIISSGKFSLEADYYNLFKIPGKLNDENILEFQYSDFGQGSGTAITYLFAFFGPENWTPAVTGAGSGWGFYEPSLKWIKFMLDRGERTRLETSVLFTNRGIAAIKDDPNYATLPDWISNTTPSGDLINDYARAMFASGKHYLPSNQLTPGRTGYGTNKNLIGIRYAEILLMHAEALVQGASSSAMTADAAVNAVRSRAGLSPLSGVTLDQVVDEKFAELAMEWGTRYYDLIRLERYNELNYDGRTFSANLTYLPYPQNQVDQLPILGGTQE
ncbi:RagB/SusD family nutrient uptake outer membrane protein [Sunxiuqinia dokdonensis]|uniref:Glycan metabolism protein RagB n=1 Tax=Sunxiuqinia dokdonensis TaxID=1409788 RepID=A0A0L8V5W6_9BACT|nr:RagB/SusD family nutrient uptake outer membrane protein [Sunxiuqinia dokdonensis]KOH43826.1 glycan metabolism protein RagB [Sunxiuqinia dokdonensis]